MDTVTKKSLQDMGKGFIGPERIPDGLDEHYLRNRQAEPRQYRPLRDGEVQHLIANHNRCPDWSQVLVTDIFNPDLIRDCRLHGLVRIGDLEECVLEYHDMQVPVG